MYKLITVVASFILILAQPLHAQDSIQGLRPFEVRVSWEVNRHSLEGTLAYSFLNGPQGCMRAEIGKIAIPFVGISGTYFVFAGEDFKVGPELSLSISPISTPLALCPGAGLTIAAKVSPSIQLLTGVRMIVVPGGEGQSIGGTLPNSQFLDLAEYKPLVLFLGIAL
jgi:hypothetical protein